jgi:fructose-1,6-bisphosphatase/inositol monophosphatase family enzyme
MHENHPNHNLPPNYEILSPSRDMQFALDSVLVIGNQMVQGRTAKLQVSAKLDRTLVSDMDIETNLWFNQQAAAAYGGAASVQAEEVSQSATEPTPEGEAAVTFVLDSIDGTGEYVATHRDARTGEPINPMRPVPIGVEIEPIADSERTTCTGLAMLRGGKLQLAAVYNPFKKQLVIADRDLGGSFIIDQETLQTGTVAGKRLRVSDQPFSPGTIPWDSAVWEGAPVDTTLLEAAAGTPPLGHYSAIDQAVTVALGQSVGAVFAGNTAHDILPAAAIVYGAGGMVAKPNGTSVHPDTIANQLEGGMVYTNVLSHSAFMHALQTGERPTVS